MTAILECYVSDWRRKRWTGHSRYATRQQLAFWVRSGCGKRWPTEGGEKLTEAGSINQPFVEKNGQVGKEDPAGDVPGWMKRRGGSRRGLSARFLGGGKAHLGRANGPGRHLELREVAGGFPDKATDSKREKKSRGIVDWSPCSLSLCVLHAHSVSHTTHSRGIKPCQESQKTSRQVEQNGGKRIRTWSGTLGMDVDSPRARREVDPKACLILVGAMAAMARDSRELGGQITYKYPGVLAYLSRYLGAYPRASRRSKGEGWHIPGGNWAAPIKVRVPMLLTRIHFLLHVK